MYGLNHWVRVPAQVVPPQGGCTGSFLQSPTASLAAVGKKLLLPTGATLWSGKCNYCACELCVKVRAREMESAVQAVEKGGALQISAYANQIICLLKCSFCLFPDYVF